MDWCLLVTLKTENFISFLSLRTKPLKTPSLEKPCGTRKFQTVRLRIVEEISFARRRSHRSVATAWFGLSRCCRDQLNNKSCCAHKRRLVLAIFGPFNWKNAILFEAYNRDLWLSARAEPLLMWFRNSREARTTFWTMTGPTMTAGAVKIGNLFTHCIRRCFRRLMCVLYFSVLTWGSRLWRRVVLKIICSMVAVVVSFGKGALRRNAEKRRLSDASRYWKRNATRPKDYFRSSNKKEHKSGCTLSGFGCTGLRHGPELVLLLSKIRTRFHRRVVRCRAF